MHRVSILNGGLCHDVHKWNERKNEKEEEDLYENASICMFYNFSSAPLSAFIFLHILYRYNDINYPALAILCEAHCIPKPFRIDHLNWALFTPLEIGCPKLCRHIRFLCNVCKHLPQQLAKTFDVIRRKKKETRRGKISFSIRCNWLVLRSQNQKPSAFPFNLRQHTRSEVVHLHFNLFRNRKHIRQCSVPLLPSSGFSIKRVFTMGITSLLNDFNCDEELRKIIVKWSH